MSIPKWTEERTQQLVNSVGDEAPISRSLVASIADELETSTRSVSSKLRKMGYDVELASAAATKAFPDEVTDQLREFVTNNAGQYTYAEIAANFPGGYTAKAIQGKILSMELTGQVKASPKPEAVKKYTDAEEASILSMINEGAYLEDIAAAIGKDLQSVRGKALAMFRSGQIGAIPKQKNVKGAAADAFDVLGDVSTLTVAEIAEKIEKSERGVKTMLTRRGLNASDYNGAAKKEKAEANA